MNRIYHPHTKWEEVNYNMYGSVEPTKKDIMVSQVIYFFSQRFLIEKYMAFVIDNFIYSCEHNFTNPSINKIAFLGQASVAAWRRIPAEITKEGWNFLDEDTQKRANNIAENELKRWKSCQKNI